MQQEITSFYYQAKFELMQNVDFDILLYHPQKPVALTMKVSLRERYKQADLESLELKRVFREARCYLITLEEEKKIKSVKSTVAGLTDVVLASSSKYDDLLKSLSKGQSQEKFCLAETTSPLEKGKLVS